MRINVELSSTPIIVPIGLGVLLLVQIALAVIALVSLYRRPAAAVATGNKWIWVAIVVLVSFIGPILYFAIGRKATGTIDRPVERQRSSADIADDLYGTGEGPKQP